MRILVIADVHGNLPALELLLKTESNIDALISLGDIVNYGPWSDECLELIDSLNVRKVLLIGNHEQYYMNGNYDSNGLAKRFFDFCFPSFTRFDLINHWPFTYEWAGYLFQHTFNGRVIYPDSQIDLNKNYIIGHSHHQCFIQNELHRLYNVGSVGQNRAFINKIDYGIFYWSKTKMELKSLIYDESIIINEMKSRKYPQEFIDYYSKKARI